jgi:NADH:ubiquinone oxidoreductase subunit F (NADH-binding)
LYACPTVVNNVETLTAVPDIIKMGGEAIKSSARKRAAARSSGPSPVMSIAPASYELPMGYDDMEKFIMEDCGGF